MVRGRRCDLAWRVLDAQYWSKPKLARRERIFVVADFTGQRAAEILFNTRSMHTDSRLCSASGLSAAEDHRGASLEAGRQIPVILPFYGFKMRGAAANRNRQHFIRSFGKRTDVFPTIRFHRPAGRSPAQYSRTRHFGKCCTACRSCSELPLRPRRRFRNPASKSDR